MRELQYAEQELLDSVQQQTLKHQRYLEAYDKLMTRSKYEKGGQNKFGVTQSYGFNTNPTDFIRPTTQSVGTRSKVSGRQQEEIQRGRANLKSQEETRPRAVMPNQI